MARLDQGFNHVLFSLHSILRSNIIRSSLELSTFVSRITIRFSLRPFRCAQFVIQDGYEDALWFEIFFRFLDGWILSAYKRVTVSLLDRLKNMPDNIYSFRMKYYKYIIKMRRNTWNLISINNVTYYLTDVKNIFSGN